MSLYLTQGIFYLCPTGVAASRALGSATSMPCGAGNGLTKEFAKERSQLSKEQSRNNCEEGKGKPPHPLPAQETWPQDNQTAFYRRSKVGAMFSCTNCYAQLTQVDWS